MLCESSGESRAALRAARYDSDMRSRAPYLLVLAAGLFVLPAFAHAGGIPFFGPIIPDAWNNCPLSFAAIIDVLNNIISFILTLAIVFVAPLTIGYAGFTLVVSQGAPAAKTKARSMILNTVVGIAIALAAWMIVDAVMAVFYDSSAVGATWQSLIVNSGGLDVCLKQSGSLTALDQATSTPGTVTGLSPAGSYTGSGSCVIPPTGPCAPSNLTAFGGAASQAAQICQAESTGNPGLASGVDKLPTGEPVSFGLFQINLTANPVGGLACPSAFSGVYKQSTPNVTITNQNLYDQCVTAAKDPNKNIDEAVKIYQAAGNSWKPWGTHTKCNLSFLGSSRFVAALCSVTTSYD